MIIAGELGREATRVAGTSPANSDRIGTRYIVALPAGVKLESMVLVSAGIPVAFRRKQLGNTCCHWL
jgi:hypothetical protein